MFARFVGKVGPTLLMLAIGAESALGQVAEGAACAIAGGLQPTTEYTAASHLPGAGAGTAGVSQVVLSSEGRRCAVSLVLVP